MLRKSRWSMAAASLLAGSALATAGCGSDDSSGSSDAAVDLNYGVLAALTGDNAPLGRPWVEGTELAVDQINRELKKRGDDSKLEVVGTEDSQGQVAAAIGAARKLVDIDKADVIVGDTASAPSIAVAQSVTIPKGVLEFTLGTSPAITELKDKGLFWRPSVSDDLQGPVIVQVLEDKLGTGGKINIGYHDDAYGQGLKDVVRKDWEASGGTVGTEVALSGKGAAYDTEAQKLVEGDPDGWVLVLFCSDWGKLRGPLARSGKWSAKRTLVADAAAYCEPPDTLDPGMGGVVSSVQGDQYPAFAQLYKANVDAPLEENAGISFDSVYLSFLAAKAAGSSDPEDIKEKLQEISGPPGKLVSFEQLPEALDALESGKDIDYDGVSSGIDFDDNGDITSNYFFHWTSNTDGGFKRVGKRFAAEG